MRTKRPGRGAVEDDIVVTVPVACKRIIEPMMELAASVAARVESARRAGEAVDYAALERETAKLTAAIERAAHGCMLEAVEVDAPHVEIGGNPRTYFRDVLLRIGQCSDVTLLTPHGWKEHFAAEVQAHRDDLARRIVGQH